MRDFSRDNPGGRVRLHPLFIAGVTALLAIGFLVESGGLFPALALAIQFNASNIPSTTAVPAEALASGHPLLSVYAYAPDLYDENRGLLTHRLERGSEWERPAIMSYFDHSKLVFASAIGLRIHGGKSRQHSPVPSYRIHFRNKVRASTFRPDAAFGWAIYPIKRLVLHNDLREDRDGEYWHFINPLAYDIARQVGSITPQTFPVEMYLNGAPQGAYVVTEHLGTDGFLKGRFGHANFEQSLAGENSVLWRWAKSLNPMTMADVDRTVDVENLTRWAVSLLFCATTDPFQGLILRDRTIAESRWFLVNWDMDHSFMDLYERAQVPWQHNTFETLLRQKDARSLLLTGMLENDPAYRAYFARTMVDALNHQLTADFLDERFRHYHTLAEEFGVQDREYQGALWDFLANRPTFMRELVGRRFSLGESLRVVVRSPAGANLSVDGQAAGAAYTGWYYKGMTARIECVPAGDAKISHWVVNGTRVPATSSASLDLFVQEATVVEPVLSAGT